jgi:hypothetical protein
MSFFVCPECCIRQSIFSESHTKELAEVAGASLLAELPIDPDIAALCDKGKIEDFELLGIKEALELLIRKTSAASIEKL